MNITILGAGAIGSLWAYHLQQAQHTVHLCLTDPGETQRTITLDELPSRSFSANQTAQIQASDLLLVTVKACQVNTAIAGILPLLAPEVIILLMHNGMGALEQLDPRLNIQQHPIVLATTSHGAYKKSAHQLLHTGIGVSHLGGYNTQGKRCDFLAEVLNHALPEVIWQQDIQQALWHKLAINCAINPLTALNQCQTGHLVQGEYSEHLRQICHEICLVMRAEGMLVEPAELLANVQRVLQATSTNYSSMQQDIFYQRPSEIDYISGYLCRYAAKHGIEVAKNQQLYQQIKQLEQNWSQDDA